MARSRRAYQAAAVLMVGVLLAFSGAAWATAATAREQPGREPYAEGRILVKFEPGVSSTDKVALNRAQGGRTAETVPGIGVDVVSVPEGAEKAKAAAYARDPRVAYAELDWVAYPLSNPNDTAFAKQWGMQNDGQVYREGLAAGKADADIDAPEAWDLATGTPNVKIAILDSGIAQDHEDLQNLDKGLQKNFTDSSTVDDRYGHGTHMAGTAAAQTSNGIGVAGVSRGASVLNAKVLNDSAVGYSSWVAQGIRWATDVGGAKVINLSLGVGRSRALEDAVNYAWGRGVVVVAAAGNGNSKAGVYPARYANTIAVAATDANDKKTSISSYGTWVEVAAPGSENFSTFPNHTYAINKSPNYDYGNGTSVSTAYVSGLAALIWAKDPTLTNSAVRSRIEQSADRIPGTGTYWSYGRINACRAVGGSCT